MLEQAAGMLIKSNFRMCPKKNYGSLKIENLQAHVSDAHIKMLERWRSKAYQRYIRTPPQNSQYA